MNIFFRVEIFLGFSLVRSIEVHLLKFSGKTIPSCFFIEACDQLEVHLLDAIN